MEDIVILLSVITAFLYAVSIAMDKHWVGPVVENTAVFSLYRYLIAVPVLLPLVATPFVGVPSPRNLVIAGLIGASNFLPLVLYYAALRRLDASVISTLTRLSTVFTAVYATVLLGQVLSLVEYAAIVVIVAGSMAVSGPVRQVGRLSMSRGVVYILSSAALYGWVNLLIEVGIDAMPLYDFLVWSNILPVIPVVLYFAVREAPRRFFAQIVSGETRVAVWRLTVSKALEVIGAAVYVLAVANGPVAIAAAGLALTPVFVFLLIAVWRVRNDTPVADSRVAVVRKSVGICLVVGGVLFL